jgi:hypothetical protein
MYIGLKMMQFIKETFSLKPKRVNYWKGKGDRKLEQVVSLPHESSTAECKSLLIL